MTVPAPIRQSDLTRAAKVAKAQGCPIEISSGGLTFKVYPDALSIADSGENPETFTTFAEYKSWKERSGAGGN